MTYGEIRLRLRQRFATLALDVLDGFLVDRYQEILDALDWQRLSAERVIAIPAEYAAGTVAVTNASTAIAGTGTTWTAQMSGRRIRFGAEAAYYTFTFTGAATGTLDRPYEGETATGVGYRINQAVYTLDADVRMVDEIAGLERLGVGDLNDRYPTRDGHGEPYCWAPTFDDSSSPPKPQIEIFPVPTLAGSLRCEVTVEKELAAGATSAALAVWVRPACLIAGVAADAQRDLGKLQESDREQERFLGLLAQMIQAEALREGPQRLKMDRGSVPHRTRRWAR